MKDLGPRNILRVPLQLLWELPDIRQRIEENTSEMKQDLSKWFAQYEPEVQHKLYQQLSLATADVSFDYTSVLKNVKTNNSDIIFFFNFLQDVIELYFQDIVTNKTNS
ncbi:hypothetical protein [Hymenobacter weizhouensis]|uniref:hypothetical protein n=1 Tax=Hymenobacter sp. YIM 151500-1 TaxID=2987689 RepID=UPI0022274608|nr:hypothetical protein [Hymenobacter sp. YIM 151500-1]UYZ64407.1 hypothetical protein OIS53_06030 [Hymenobacter sp. YIM 151500-1]